MPDYLWTKKATLAQKRAIASLFMKGDFNDKVRVSYLSKVVRVRLM